MSFHKMQAAFNIRAMSPTDLLHPLTIPLLPFAAAVLARVIPDQSGRTPWMAAIGAMMLTGLVAAFHDAGDGDWFRMDALASLMAFLVSMLGAVVLRFAARYLNGDPKRSQFLSWMCLTLASVLTMVIANHLLILAAAWMATSLFLHRLLLHHPERSGAVFAARKKAVFSRLAEVLLLAAIWILQEAHGTWKIDELVASIADGNHVGLASAAWLLIICAMLKSAQFPFHSWLPDTMDTPTPVSAFMHAGIINAGGFLILRLAPIFTATPNSLNFLALAGVLTAAFGAIVMLTQAGVKRALAFSTIAQMGFMMVQCGLGAWQLALLHLVAHSVYKAHAFLHAGSTIGSIPRAAVPLATPALLVGLLAGFAWVGLLMLLCYELIPWYQGSPAAFYVIIALALAYGIGRAWSGNRAILSRALVAAGLVGATGIVLHLAIGQLITDWPKHQPPAWIVGLVTAVFVLLFFLQSLIWRASAHPLGRRLYVHALNGFYIGTLANRLLASLWPSQSPSPTQITKHHAP